MGGEGKCVEVLTSKIRPFGQTAVNRAYCCYKAFYVTI